jgi:Mg2+ and Co2+ transporter CorA
MGGVQTPFGFYGQNVPYPRFQRTGGFISSIVLIFAFGIDLYVLFEHIS